MKIRFLGTGAAEGVPAMFCNCAYCNEIRRMGESEFRTRAQVLIDGVLSVDFPPEAYAHALKFGVNYSKLKCVLVTHSHMDHFYAHDFILRGYKYAQISGVLEIYGNSEVKAVYEECTAREMKPEVAPNIRLNEISAYTEFNVGEYKVITVPAQHSAVEEALLFYIERDGKGYLHLHDTGRISDSAFSFLKERGAKAHVVAFDCTFIERTGGEVSRHMGICDDMLMKQKLENFGITNAQTRYIITHFSHNPNPTRARLKQIEKEYGVTAAYDGMTVEI